MIKHDKLQELTDRLYKEGLSKGKQDADAMLAKAREEAAAIVADAKAEAERVLAQAVKESEELKVKAEGDLKISSAQALAAVREKIENVIEFKCIKAPVSDALAEKEFVQSLIKTVVGAFNPADNAKPLEIILPQEMKEELDSFITGGIAKECAGLEVKFERDFSRGFKVSRKDSGFFIDFTDDSFGKIISQYLRPKTRKLLFGE